jgi:hypothetical protein
VDDVNQKKLYLKTNLRRLDRYTKQGIVSEINQMVNEVGRFEKELDLL